jgi:biopolymer transport protein ExbD
VTQDGRFFVGKSEVVQNTLDGVKAAIAQVAAGDMKQKVIIRADAQSQHQHVILAMDALSQLGFSNLSIATVKPSAP